MEKQNKFEVGISEVNLNQHSAKTGYPIFEQLRGVHFTMWAHDKQEVAEKIAKIIASATGTEITYSPEPYLNSVLEWCFATKEFDCNITVEQM